jgi:hypothetical protein
LLFRIIVFANPFGALKFAIPIRREIEADVGVAKALSGGFYRRRCSKSKYISVVRRVSWPATSKNFGK